MKRLFDQKDDAAKNALASLTENILHTVWNVKKQFANNIYCNRFIVSLVSKVSKNHMMFFDVIVMIISDFLLQTKVISIDKILVYIFLFVFIFYHSYLCARIIFAHYFL